MLQSQLVDAKFQCVLQIMHPGIVQTVNILDAVNISRIEALAAPMMKFDQSAGIGNADTPGMPTFGVIGANLIALR